MELTKEKRILKEKNKLKRIFSQIPDDRKKMVENLLENAAFMAITLSDLQISINENGPTSEYKNGANQFGIKKSPELEAYNIMIKNYATVMRQLMDLLPAGASKDEAGVLEFIKNNK